jgi:cephalosporin hydroxylase
MKTIGLFVLLLSSFLYGQNEVEDLKEEVRQDLPELQGWCSVEKAMSFIDLVLEVKPRLCVEIGVFTGTSLYPVAAALRHLGRGVVVGVDPWDKIECLRYLDLDRNKADVRWVLQINFDHVYFGFVNTLRYLDIEQSVIVCRTTSQRVASIFGQIDILHIDGNHQEEAILQDVRLYLPKVRPGGYIWLNDAKWPSVQKGMELLLPHCTIIKQIDQGNCILFQKNV